MAGRVIDNIYFGLDSLKAWEDQLTGSRVKSIETRGKAMIIRLDMGRDDDLYIYSHNQLYGRWHFCNTDEYPDSQRQLRIAIDCQGQSALLYSASDIAVLNQYELQNHRFLCKLGPDVLSQLTTVENLVERLSSTKYCNRQLGGVMTDQSFVAGLGNYLRCEILFYAGLSPRVRSRDLNDKELQFLANAILKLARQSYQAGGITNNLDYAKILMEQGANYEEARFYVFRRQGKACYHCGSQIEKKVHAGQACFYCPECQQQ